jgi:hypothetical protein
MPIFFRSWMHQELIDLMHNFKYDGRLGYKFPEGHMGYLLEYDAISRIRTVCFNRLRRSDMINNTKYWCTLNQATTEIEEWRNMPAYNSTLIGIRRWKY